MEDQPPHTGNTGGDTHFMDLTGPDLGPLCQSVTSPVPSGPITVHVEQVTCAACLIRLNSLLADLRNRQVYGDWASQRAKR